MKIGNSLQRTALVSKLAIEIFSNNLRENALNEQAENWSKSNQESYLKHIRTFSIQQAYLILEEIEEYEEEKN